MLDSIRHHLRFGMLAFLLICGGLAVLLGWFGRLAYRPSPPSQDQVLAAWTRAQPVEGGLPFMHEIERSNVRVDIREKSWSRFECRVRFDEVKRIGWPVPHTTMTSHDSRKFVIEVKSNGELRVIRREGS